MRSNEGRFLNKGKTLNSEISLIWLHSIIPSHYFFLHRIIPFIWWSFRHSNLILVQGQLKNHHMASYTFIIQNIKWHSNDRMTLEWWNYIGMMECHMEWHSHDWIEIQMMEWQWNDIRMMEWHSNDGKSFKLWNIIQMIAPDAKLLLRLVPNSCCAWCQIRAVPGVK